MEILSEIIRMQKEGFSDQEIFARLRNEGVSPKQIKDAVNQARIKSAVFAADEPGKKAPLNQSIMDNTEDSLVKEPLLKVPSPEDFSSEAPPQNFSNEPYQGSVAESNYAQGGYSSQESPEYYPQESSPVQQENYYPSAPQGYSGQNYYMPQGNVDSQTISEITESIVVEKITELKKEYGDVGYFQRRTEDKINEMDDRLKKIEQIIDRLQMAIIDKIGEFGQSTNLIHKDLDNLHDTVSKLMNPLVDNYQQLQRLTSKN